MPTIDLPTRDRRLEPFTLSAASPWPREVPAVYNRIAYAAVHVVADPFSDRDPSSGAAVDWEATMAFRRTIWDLGLGVADAMDTAQRGMGMDWPISLELIRRTIDAARDYDGNALAVFGTGTDQLDPDSGTTVEDVIAAYEEQCEAVETAGGRIVLMASRALASCARSVDDYERVYAHVLGQTTEPVIIHWLGEMFDPALAGYWGSDDLEAATDVCLRILEDNAAKVEGIKVSVLNEEHEVAMRRRLPAGIRMYTGDDFNFARLIAGDEAGHSDALLGIFDVIAPAASAALTALAGADKASYERILAPTVPLSRHIFQAPTRFYKTGVVFMAYLNGHQDHFTVVGGQQGARSLLHLSELFRLADAARLLADPDLAVARMRNFLAIHGI